MNHKYILLLVLFLGIPGNVFQLSAQSHLPVVIEITQLADFDTYTEVDSTREIQLVFNGYPHLKQKDIFNLNRLPFNQIRHLVLMNMKLDNKTLGYIFRMFNTNELRTLSLIHMEVKKMPPVIFKGFLQHLETVRIMNSRLHKKFYEIFTVEQCPKLTHLELINNHLGKGFVKTLRKSRLIPRLKYLDLSGNKLTNRVLSLFLTDEPGNLETLVLNNCDLTISSREVYTEKFPAISRKIAMGGIAVDWNSPFFQHLTHLELENPSKSYLKTSELIGDSSFLALDIFKGFYFSTENSAIKYIEYLKSFQNRMTTTDVLFEELKQNARYQKISRSRALLFQYMLLPYRSRYTNYSISKLAELEKIYRSPQKNYLENLILRGSRWNDIIVRLVLKNCLLPNLKYIILNDVNMTQAEIYHLIHDFPQYSFEVHRTIWMSAPKKAIQADFNPDYWPRVTWKK